MQGNLKVGGGLFAKGANLKRKPVSAASNCSKPATAADGSSKNASSNCVQEPGKSLASIAGYSSNSSDSSSDEEPRLIAKRARQIESDVKTKVEPKPAPATTSKPIAFVSTSKPSHNQLAVDAMRAKMTGDLPRYNELMQRINRGENE